VPTTTENLKLPPLTGRQPHGDAHGTLREHVRTIATYPATRVSAPGPATRVSAPGLPRGLFAFLLAASLAGCARDREGQPPASPQPTESADEPLAVTVEPFFRDMSDELGIDFVHVVGRRVTYFFPEIMVGGGALLDYDQDGDLDVYLVNGNYQHDGLPGPGPLPAVNRLYRQEADGRFTDVTAQSGLDDDAYGMGVAVGDINNDGDVDFLVVNAGGRAQLFFNIAEKKGNWLRVRAVEPSHGGRDSHGAVVSVLAGDRVWKRTVRPGSGYCSSHDPRVHFGLGPVARIDKIHVLWPDGQRPASSVMQDALRRHPESAEVRYVWGVCVFESGDHKKAAEILQDVVARILGAWRRPARRGPIRSAPS